MKKVIIIIKKKRGWEIVSTKEEIYEILHQIQSAARGVVFSLEKENRVQAKKDVNEMKALQQQLQAAIEKIE